MGLCAHVSGAAGGVMLMTWEEGGRVGGSVPKGMGSLGMTQGCPSPRCVDGASNLTDSVWKVTPGVGECDDGLL